SLEVVVGVVDRECRGAQRLFYVSTRRSLAFHGRLAPQLALASTLDLLIDPKYGIHPLVPRSTGAEPVVKIDHRRIPTELRIGRLECGDDVRPGGLESQACRLHLRTALNEQPLRLRARKGASRVGEGRRRIALRGAHSHERRRGPGGGKGSTCRHTQHRGKKNPGLPGGAAAHRMRHEKEYKKEPLSDTFRFSLQRPRSRIHYNAVNFKRFYDMRLLIVEDDRELSEALGALLKQSGYEVDAHSDGRAALNALLTSDYDL